ncbi:COG4648 family protein [Hydrogenovibrio halophilus]|uniref:hypothetical protein n=1 Tax=Hydrogenovibrio halophilus TaxID=373391 RepID=UPI00036E428E|nr:hypothetical protein [Hydrogenovibrio halophilus]
MTRLIPALLMVALIIGLGMWLPDDWQSWRSGLSLIVLLPVWLGFTLSLRPHNMPMITRFAQWMNPSLTQAERRYTRLVTWVWVGLLSLMLATKLGLMCLTHSGRLEHSLFSESLFLAGCLIVIGFWFRLEFCWRQKRFPEKQNERFWPFVQQLLQAPPTLLWKNPPH